MEIIQQIKAKNNYTENPKRCRSCDSFLIDMATDNFGPGDQCIRNPDAKFPTKATACCDRYSEQKPM